MKKSGMIKTLSLTIGSMILMGVTTQTAKAADAKETIQIELSTGGPVVIELLPDIAPKHVEQIKSLAAKGFYDNLVFHRVISGFMAQTGDPTGTGRGGSDLPNIPAEFSDYAYKRGTVGMARSMDPDSANSQFFICFNDTGCSSLTGQYTVWGQVTSGMEYVDAVAVGEPPASPDKMVKVTVGSGTAPQESAPASGGETPAQ